MPQTECGARVENAPVVPTFDISHPREIGLLNSYTLHQFILPVFKVLLLLYDISVLQPRPAVRDGIHHVEEKVNTSGSAFVDSSAVKDRNTIIQAFYQVRTIMKSFYHPSHHPCSLSLHSLTASSGKWLDMEDL